MWEIFFLKGKSYFRVRPVGDKLISCTCTRTTVGQIRLLELLPGIGEEPIEGRVIVSSLDSTSKYSAMSYVWGLALRPFYLQTMEGKVPLTASLHSALKRLRKKDAPILLWVDAICINQNDELEKVIQIRL